MVKRASICFETRVLVARSALMRAFLCTNIYVDVVRCCVKYVQEVEWPALCLSNEPLKMHFVVPGIISCQGSAQCQAMVIIRQSIESIQTTPHMSR